MSIFAKKPEWEQKVMNDVATAPMPVPKLSTGKGYGIAEAIQLLRSLPSDPSQQTGELVVRVVRATLASLDVHLADIIEDATRKQKYLADRMAAEHTQIAELERQLEGRRREIAAIDADLKETTTVKDRLQQAERGASLTTGGAQARAAAAAARPTTTGATTTGATTTGATTGATPGPELVTRSTNDDPTRH